MSSREKILSTVGANQPAPRELPPLASGVDAAPQGSSTAPQGSASSAGLATQFIAVLESIGGVAYTVSGFPRVATILHEQFPGVRRVVSGCPELPSFGIVVSGNEDPHTLDDVDLAILPAHFGVAENGACWITEAQMLHRALPFITQHLALVIQRRDIVADMHQAYDRIALIESVEAPGSPAAAPYGFATFIAGPSKTADIEQSLVLGAHGPISLTVFLLDEHLSDAGFY
jgi:L-lactate dehydrogenase complex protein LldG